MQRRDSQYSCVEGKQFSLLWRVSNICIWALKTLQVMEGFRKVFCFFWNGWLSLFFVFALWILKQLCSSPMEIIKRYLFIYLFILESARLCLFHAKSLQLIFQTIEKRVEKQIFNATYNSFWFCLKIRSHFVKIYVSKHNLCMQCSCGLSVYCSRLMQRNAFINGMSWFRGTPKPASRDKCSTNFWPPSS